MSLNEKMMPREDEQRFKGGRRTVEMNNDESGIRSDTEINLGGFKTNQ
jgi:hypothetical protein